MIKIKNKNKGHQGQYVGRGSPLGNPFKLKYDCAKERDRVIELYRKWLYKKIEENDKEVVNEMLRLYEISKNEDLHLLCFCAPKKCHAEIIKDILEYWKTEDIY